MSPRSGTMRILEAIRESGAKTRFYQASSSEMFGKVQEIPQRETTPFHPRSPYAVSKVFAYWATVNYRESYNLFACNGILFNHESPRRGETFVTRKITRAARATSKPASRRSSTWATSTPSATGATPRNTSRPCGSCSSRTSRTITSSPPARPTPSASSCEEAFSYVGLDWKDYVEIDPRYFRPAEVDLLIGDASKAKRILGWEPKTKFKELVHLMVDADIKALADQLSGKIAARSDHADKGSF